MVCAAFACSESSHTFLVQFQRAISMRTKIAIKSKFSPTPSRQLFWLPLKEKHDIFQFTQKLLLFLSFIFAL